MATIRKRGDHQWQAQIRRKGYPLQSHTFILRADAEAWARMLEREMDTGKWQPRQEAERTTLDECLIRYLREITSHKKGAAQESNKIKNLRLHPLAQCFMSNIRGKDIAAYRDERLAQGISASTYQKDHALLSHVFTVARREWGMESLTNPVELVKRPLIRNTRDRRLVGDEEARLLAAASIFREMPQIITLAIETAMRRGELAGLRWPDIKKNIVTLEDTKNGETRRVPLSNRALSVLDSLPRRIDKKVFKTGANFITTGFPRVCAKAGIQNLRFHDLRHESTSRLFEKGLNPMQVAAITGHKTLQMLKRYTHLRAEDLAKMLG